MPARETAPIGAPCWVDLMTSDTARSREFYRGLLGWGAEEPNEAFGGYFNFLRDGARIAGCMSAQAGMGVPDVWSVYLASDDAAKTVETATANGGTVIVEPMAVADLGTMAVITDCGGAAIGIWQPNTYHGFGVVGETAAPSWFELTTRDYDAVIPFYRDVFRLESQTLSDTPEMRYTILLQGEDQVAGIMDGTGQLPEGAPAHWAVYFGVDDTDAAVTRTVELGGQVVVPAMDTPYGRLAGVRDATGAWFSLVAPNEQMPARS